MSELEDNIGTLTDRVMREMRDHTLELCAMLCDELAQTRNADGHYCASVIRRVRAKMQAGEGGADAVASDGSRGPGDGDNGQSPGPR